MRVPPPFATGEYRADALVASGDTLLDDLDDVPGALKHYQATLAQYPQTARLAHVYGQMAICHLLEGDPARAKELLSRALAERPPEDPDAPPSGWERLLEACDRPGAFLPDYERQRTASRVAREMRRADLYFTAKEYERAARAYESIVKTVPGTEDAAYALMQAARCYNQLSRYELALERYEGFRGRYKDSQWADDALMRAGVVWVGPMGRQDKGRELFELVLARYPHGNETPTALMHLATLAFWNEDWPKALLLHEALVRDYPECKYVRFVQQIRLPRIQEALNKKPAGVTKRRQG